MLRKTRPTERSCYEKQAPLRGHAKKNKAHSEERKNKAY
jgi:hypothetical protein